MSSPVLSSYLKALRATRIAFNGDSVVLKASRTRIRDGFKNPDVSKSLDERLKEINDISKFLVANVVQAKRVGENENKYRLNIHKNTELGDNESVKKAKKVLVAAGGGCCGGANAKI